MYHYLFGVLGGERMTPETASSALTARNFASGPVDGAPSVLDGITYLFADGDGYWHFLWVAIECTSDGDVGDIITISCHFPQ